jgi:hypothetical protein
MACWVASGTSYHSLCMRCSARFSVLTGWKVPAPTCSVTLARCTPRASRAASSAVIKMQRGRGRGHGAGVAGKHRLVALHRRRRESAWVM